MSHLPTDTNDTGDAADTNVADDAADRDRSPSPADDASSAGPEADGRASRSWLGAAIFGVGGVLLAKVCCIGPIVLAAFGVGAGGAGAFSLGWLRWPLLAIAIGALGLAFHRVYARRRPSVASQIVVWSAAVLVGLAFVVPQWLSSNEAVSAEPSQGQSRVVFEVKGFTCAGCATGLETELLDVDGVVDAAVDFEEATAAVVYEPDTVSAIELQRVIEALDYEVAIVDG